MDQRQPSPDSSGGDRRMSQAPPVDRWAEGETAPPRLRSRDLFGSARRIIIDHEGREYCLLITRQGKLILNRGS